MLCPDRDGLLLITNKLVIDNIITIQKKIVKLISKMIVYAIKYLSGTKFNGLPKIGNLILYANTFFDNMLYTKRNLFNYKNNI